MVVRKRSYKKRKQCSKSTIEVPKPLKVLRPSQETNVAESKNEQKTQVVETIVDPVILSEIEEMDGQTSQDTPSYNSTTDGTDDDLPLDGAIEDDVFESDDDDPDYDDEYNEEMEEDKGDLEDRSYDKLRDRGELLEMLAENASRIGQNGVMVSAQQTQGGRQRKVCTPSLSVEKGPKKRRGRGPIKGIKVTEPMYLEYDSLGQPCGRWRRKYGTQIGLCMRQLCILWKWKEVPEGLKKELWEDTVDLFHIQPDEAKKEVFLSALAERFRGFKSQLVSGWITFRRERSKAKTMKTGKVKENEDAEERENEARNEQEEKAVEREQMPLRMPYQIWDHITKDDWEAFVAKKTSPKEVEKRDKASKSAKMKKYYHHLGPKTYDEKRKEWIQEGFYPIISTSPSSSSSTVKRLTVDRTSDWYCGLHGKDASGRRTIPNPETRELAEAVIGWKHKEATGEFVPKANKDALYMVLGKDHDGRVIGKGGVRLGLKKVFGKEYSATKASSRSNEAQNLDAIKSTLQEELEMKMKNHFTAMLEHMGLPSLENFNVISGDKLSQQDPSTPTEVPDRMPSPPISEPSIPDSKEEPACNLLLPKSGVVGGELIAVACGRAQPPRAGQKVQLLPLVGSYLSVCIDTVIGGFEDFSLPVPRPEQKFQNLIDAQGSSVTWPCAWVQYIDEGLQKRKMEKAKNAKLNKEGLQGNEEDSQTKKFNSDAMIKNVGSQAKKMESKSRAMLKNADSQAEKKKSKSQAIGKEADLPSKCVDEQNPKSSTPQVTPKGIPLVGKQVLDSLSKDCFWMHTCVSNLPDETSIQVDLEPSQFHCMADPSTWVYQWEVRDFLSQEMVKVSIIQVFMSALYEDLRELKSVSKIGWFCPQEICAAHCLTNQPHVKEYIGSVIAESARVGDKFIIAPYLEDFHWILLVISPSTHTIYQFDSARQVNGRNILIKALLNSEMKKLRGNSLRRAMIPQWKSVKCAQQEKGVDCGYYVMRFMYDTVSFCTEVDDLEKVYNTPREEPFTIAEIDEVRDKFARFLTNNCL